MCVCVCGGGGSGGSGGGVKELHRLAYFFPDLIRWTFGKATYEMPTIFKYGATNHNSSTFY